MITIICQKCGEKIRAYPSQNRKYCSTSCWYKQSSKNKLGLKLSEHTKKKISRSHKGIVPWNKGRGIVPYKIYTTTPDGEECVKIPLTQNKYALIDEEDWERINSYKWRIKSSSNTEYAQTGDSKSVFLHRFIMSPPNNKEIDHINGNGLDNRKKNLRICTRSQNIINRKFDNKTGYRGVKWYKPYKKWTAVITKNYKSYNLGYFLNKEDAAHAYNKAAIKYHGNFAQLNKIGGE